MAVSDALLAQAADDETHLWRRRDREVAVLTLVTASTSEGNSQCSSLYRRSRGRGRIS